MKIYSHKCITATTPDCQEMFDKLYQLKKDMKNSLTGIEYDASCIHFHHLIRKALDLPNQIFAFAKKKETHEVVLCLFDIEPGVGKIYDVHHDENGVYIEVGDEYVV